MIKETILNILTMRDVINKYRIPIKKDMCNCPFHKDKTASMKIYDKTFYCFSCHRGGDLIQFVEFLFNLNFQEAMEKINYDFGLNLKTRGFFKKEDILKIQKKYEEQKQKEMKIKEKNNLLLNQACLRYRIYNNILKKIKKQTNRENWEENVEIISYLQEKLEILDLYIENKLNNMLK